MKSIRFMKEPGYTYDLLFIFTLYFNREYCESKFANPKKVAADVQFYEKTLEEFLPISDDLLLFFRLNDEGRTFMTRYYFDPYSDVFLSGSYNLSFIQEKLFDYDQLIDNILAFYFGDQPEDVRAQCKGSMAVANKLICASDYDASVKAALYAFLIDPYSVIRRLAHELMTKEFQLSKQYERNADKRNLLQNELDIDKLAADLNAIAQAHIDITDFDNLIFSLCWNNKNRLDILCFSDCALLSIGSDYCDMVESLKESSAELDLHAFGMCLSETNRVLILKMLLEKHEITLKDVEQVLSIGSTNAYYHMSFMMRNGLLKTRNMGRTIFYSLNHTYFEQLIGALRPYSDVLDKQK